MTGGWDGAPSRGGLEISQAELTGGDGAPERWAGEGTVSTRAPLELGSVPRTAPGASEPSFHLLPQPSLFPWRKDPPRRR